MEAQRYKQLLKALQKQEKAIAKEMVAWGRKDGRARVTRLHEEAETGGSFDDFLKVAAGRSAVRFLLRGVYVRVLEDLGLLEEPRLRGQRSYQAFREIAPGLGYRAYLAWIYRDLAADFPALFEPSRDELPMPSEALCRAVWDLWQEKDGSAQLLYDWSDAEGFNSRFLGDLYEELDRDVRKRFALRQTPAFVEEHILDLVMGRPGQSLPEKIDADEVALREFDPKRLRENDDAFRLLDPTCGSGHFLVGAFHRLADYWEKSGLDSWDAAEAALESVWGCDINPYAVDIARFRLLLEVVSRTGAPKLERLASLELNLRAMDSLIPWEGWEGARGANVEMFPGQDRLATYATANERAANAAFLGRSFAVVVGNPPFVPPKDARKRDDYRAFFPASARGKYALAGPFTQRFIELTCQNGSFGMINGNGWLRRSFGKLLVERVLTQVTLDHIIDSQISNIPGHEGIPTVIVCGRRRARSDSHRVWVVGGLQKASLADGESTPDLAWQQLVSHRHEDGYRSRFISVTAQEQQRFDQHPWSLGDGQSLDLIERLEESGSALSSGLDWAGFNVVTSASDFLHFPPAALRREPVSGGVWWRFVPGAAVRDYALLDAQCAAFPVPYTKNLEVRDIEEIEGLEQMMWPHRSWLRRRFVSGGTTMDDAGLPYHAIPQFSKKKTQYRYVVAMAEVASQNDFSVVQRSYLFDRTAPVFRLSGEQSSSRYFALLALMSCSVFEFWGRSRFHNKRHMPERFDEFYQRSANVAVRFPVPPALRSLLSPEEAEGEDFLLEFARLGRSLTTASAAREDERPSSVVASYAADGGLGLPGLLSAARASFRARTETMVALQEELDWLAYSAFSLAQEEQSRSHSETASPEPISAGHRPFEIFLARRNESSPMGERSSWFRRFGHPEVTEIPQHYRPETRARMQARLDVIAENREIRLIEQPQFKRRWQMPDWDKEVTKACESWLLDRLEDLFAPPSEEAPDQTPPPLAHPKPYSLEDVVSEWRKDPRVRAVAEVYTGEEHVELETLAERLLTEHGVPDQPYRIYTDEGMRKLREWQDVWALQDREDAGETLKKPIPKPPEFTKGDFQDERFLKVRGKLNVPRERFIVFADLFPARYGWNGWRDMDRALAQVEVYTAAEGDPLVPLPTPTTADPRRCGATLGLWESLPDVRRWVGASEEGELRALAEEACQQKSCPCDVVKAWQKWQAGDLEIEAEAELADDEDVTVEMRSAVLKRFDLAGGNALSITELSAWWPHSPTELERILEDLVASGDLSAKGKGKRRKFTPRDAQVK